MKVNLHTHFSNQAKDSYKLINHNINKSNKNLPLKSINSNRNNILNNYVLYKRIVGFSLNFTGQYLTKKKKRKVVPYAMSKGPLYNTVCTDIKTYNNITYNKYPGYINEYSKSTTYNNTLVGKIGLNTKITVV